MTGIVRLPAARPGAVCVLLGIGLASQVALAQQRVGVDSAVNPAAMGIPPGALPRRLVLGQDVVFNERITTEAQGQTQILFVDESTLSVGPNANMVIDQFVYDPNAGTGKLVASLGRGVFRFVGGKLSKQDNAVTMRTPTATIGIRGGVMLVRVRPDCTAPASLGATGCNALQVIFVYGKGVTVTGLNGASQTTNPTRLRGHRIRARRVAFRPRPGTAGRHRGHAGPTRRPRRRQWRRAGRPDRSHGHQQRHRQRDLGQCRPPASRPRRKPSRSLLNRRLRTTRFSKSYPRQPIRSPRTRQGRRSPQRRSPPRCRPRRPSR